MVLGQLGNRVQHALRAFTPRDQKAVKAAATTFRQNPDLNVEAAITELGVGEALVSMLDEKGTPGIVRRALIVPPHSRLGAITPDQRQRTIQSSIIAGHYENAVDRDSAYEMLKERAEQTASELQDQAEASKPSPLMKGAANALGAFATSAARAVGSSLGRQIIRGVLGSIFGGSSGRRTR